MDFVIRKGQYHEIPRFLTLAVIGFAESHEYNLTAKDNLDLPGVVCAAFANYILRLHDEQTGNTGEPELGGALESAYDALERLASSEDPEVVNAVIVEVLQSLGDAPAALEYVYPMLRPNSRRLYDEWVGSGIE